MLRIIFLLMIVGIFLPSILFAGDLVKFQPDTKAKASEVNQNFETLLNKIQNLNSTVQELKTKLNNCCASKPTPGDTWTEPNTGMEFVFVEDGCYQMGCGSWTDNCVYNEKPVHEVCVDRFWISKYEVTIDEYRDYLQATGNGTGVDFGSSYCPINNDSTYSLTGNKFGTKGTQPMVEVSWHGGKAMTKWLTDNTSHTFRLPTEAEWEYAARGGGKEQKYAGGNDLDSLAWYDGNSGGHTHNVGTKDPNGLGIYDMSGNVWEWCSDWYSGDYYSNSPTDNPQGPDSGSHRVVRGGSWYNRAVYVRTAYRNHYYAPSFTYYNFGLRLVRTAD